MTKQLIKIAHSPDSDDAFMFYALKHGKVTSDDYDFDIERKDIEELNRQAKDEIYDISAISIHAYAHLSDKYALTASGASMAELDYGPMVIANTALTTEELKNVTVAVPGEWTTACLMLKIFHPQIKIKVIPFEDIMPAVKEGIVDAGLIIHEGQLQYKQQGFHKVLPLMDVWRQISPTLPLPLGGNAVKKSLGKDKMLQLSQLQKESIDYATEHAADARDYALQFKRDLSAEEADKYLSWYANDRTLDMGTEGKEAIELLLDKAYEKGLLPKKITVEIV